MSLPQQRNAVAEVLIELTVKIVAVGNNDKSGILHFRHPGKFGDKTAHGNGFSTALCMPDHTAPVITGRCLDCRVHRRPDRVELVVSGNFLDDLFTVLLKDNEIAEIIQEKRQMEKSFDDSFQFQFEFRLLLFVFQCAPDLKTLLVGSQRTDSRRNAIGNNQSLIVVEKVGNIVFIILKLIERIPDVGIFIGHILEFNDKEG